MELVIDRQGTVRCVYGEMIDLAALGPPSIRRASQVEPDGTGKWWADMTPVGGAALGPYERRSEALDAEHAWLERHWLSRLGQARHHDRDIRTVPSGN
jgi:hypothetical protein